MPEKQNKDTFDTNAHNTKVNVNLLRKRSSLAVLRLVRNLTSSITFSTERLKSPLAFNANVAEEKLTFNLATKRKTSAKRTTAVQSEFDMRLKNDICVIQVSREKERQILEEIENKK